MHKLRELVSSRPLHTVRKGQKVKEAVRIMAQYKIGALPVLDGERLAGIFTERDVMMRVVDTGADPAKTEVDAVMTSQLCVVDASCTLDDCLKRMYSAGCRHMLVVDGGKLVGIVSLRDILHWDLDEKEEEIHWLKEYIEYVPPPPPQAEAK